MTPIGRIILAWLAAGSLWLRADPPAGYYSAAEGKRGAELRVALHAIIRNHHVIPYSSSSPNDTSDALRELDEDPANTNNVLCIYSGKSEAKSTFGISGGWNREHCWCNSYGLDGVEPAYSDLHNLRPEDSNVNSSRQNKLYDVSDTNSLGYKFPAHVEAPLASADSDSWEPPPNVRGDVARAVFYMAVRYTGDHTNEPALFPTDWTGQITSSTNLMGRLSTLLQWHRADPPNDRERQRNDRVFEHWQHNRNPFIDHPEWLEPAFCAELQVYRGNHAITLEWSAGGHPATTRYEWEYVYGALEVLEDDAQFRFMPSVSLDFSRDFLQQLAASDPQAEHVVIWDQAGFHPRAGDADRSARIHLLPLPPYSPELNPEGLWDQVQDGTCNQRHVSLDALEKTLTVALRPFWEAPARVLSLIHHWLHTQANATP